MTTEIVLAAPATTAEATAIVTEGSYCFAIWAGHQDDKDMQSTILSNSAFIPIGGLSQR